MAWTAADLEVFRTALYEMASTGMVTTKTHRGVSLEKDPEALRALVAEAERDVAAEARSTNMPFTHFVPGRRR